MNYKGIDIYNGQGRPDFAKVKEAGISYVILKATEGVDYVDPSFTVNAQAAKDAGLPIGAYHFLRATPIDQQAQDFLTAVGPYKPCMLAIDVEEPKAGSTEIHDLGKSGITSRILTINSAARNAGYTCPIYVYGSKSWFGYLIDTDACRQAGMKIWMAAYSNDTPENTDHSDICDMWQWCSDGSVNGISGNVDMDVSYSAITDDNPPTQPTSSDGVSISVAPSSIDIHPDSISINTSSLTGIAEHGSSSNGEYWKFGDGLLICLVRITGNAAYSNAWGSMYESHIDYSQSWPYAFAAKPYAVVYPEDTTAIMEALHYDANGILPFYVMRPVSGSADYNLSVVAIGSWK